MSHKSAGMRIKEQMLAKNPNYYRDIAKLAKGVSRNRTYTDLGLERNRLCAALGGLNAAKDDSEDARLERLNKRQVILDKIATLDKERAARGEI